MKQKVAGNKLDEGSKLLKQKVRDRKYVVANKKQEAGNRQ